MAVFYPLRNIHLHRCPSRLGLLLQLHLSFSLGGRQVNDNSGNAERLFYHLYERVSSEALKRCEKLEEEVPIKKGQKTIILRTKKTYNRGYEPNWTEEIFTVK